MSAFIPIFSFGVMPNIFTNMFDFGRFGFGPFGFGSPLNFNMNFRLPLWGYGFNSLPSANDFKLSSTDIYTLNTKPVNPLPSFKSDLSLQVPVLTNTDTFTKTRSSSATVKPAKGTGIETYPAQKSKPREKDDFDKMLSFVLEREGGYVENDCGQACNYGIQQKTYDAYRTRRGLPKKHVKYITKTEVRDLYYNDFYLAVGADEIKDPKLALYAFDTAVNMGVSRAREFLEASNGDCAKFEKLRLNKYEAIAQNNPDKKKYLKGWKNRVSWAHDFADKQFSA